MNYFVTGATGNVGNEIVRKLLRELDTHVWVLMRAKSEDELSQKKQRLLNFWGFPAVQAEEYLNKLHAVRGDMSLPRFGMTHEDWGRIVNSCDRIIHAAGVVKMNLPIIDARKYAVGSARNVIALCDCLVANGRKVNVAFVSTVGVAGKLKETLRDEWVTTQRVFHNTYEQSKAEAEELLRRWDRGPSVQLTIHRPSMVVGSSDGRILHHQIFYYLCEFLSGRYTLGLQPRLRGVRLDTVPVGYVADAICWALKSAESDGKIFNLCSGPGKEVELLTVQKWARQVLSEAGKKLPRIYELPLATFAGVSNFAVLVAPARIKKRLKTLPVLIDYLKSPQVFDGDNSRHYLELNAQLLLPDPEDYLPNIIQKYYC